MITLRNVLQNSLLLTLLLVSSIAQPMKRKRDETDATKTDQSAAKRQKVEQKMIKLQSEDGVIVEISKAAAIHSQTLKDMIDDADPKDNSSKMPLFMRNISTAMLQHIVNCLNFIDKITANPVLVVGNDVNDDIDYCLTSYIRDLKSDERDMLLAVASFFDIKPLIDALKKRGACWTSVFDEQKNLQPVEQKSQEKEKKQVVANSQVRDHVKLAWAGANGQSINLPIKLAQHSPVIKECVNIDVLDLDVSQETFGHIVECLKIIDTNTDENNQLNAMTENLKNKALGFTDIEAALWQNLFQNMEDIKRENRFNLRRALINYVSNLTRKNLCQLTNAAWYLNIVPLIGVCEKECVECFSSNEGLRDFKLLSMKSISGLVFDFSNKCAQKLDYFHGIKEWLKELPVTTLTEHTDWVNSVSFSPDGKTLASGSGDKTIKLWKEINGIWICIKTLEGHTGSVHSVYFSPDGKILASGSRDKTIKLWNVITGECIATLIGHDDMVNSVCFSPDGETLASGSEDKTIKLWKQVNGLWVCSGTLDGHANMIISLCFSPDGKTLASGSYDKTIKLWNEINDVWICIETLSHNFFIESICFSPDGNTLASGSRGKFITLWKKVDDVWVNSGTLDKHTNSVSSVSFSSDGKTLASGSLDGTVKIWEEGTIQNGEEVNGIWLLSNTFNACDYEWVQSVCFSSDGILASGSCDKTIKLWNFAQKKVIECFFSCITIERAMFLKLVYQANKAGTVFDLTGDIYKHLREIFESLPVGLQELLLKKEIVKIKS